MLEADLSEKINNNSSAEQVSCPSYTSVDVHKWGVLTIRCLIFWNMLRISRGLSKQQVFQSSCDILKGDVLLWYMNNCSKFTDWDHLVEQLKLHFLPCDYQYNLEIQNRKQLYSESTTLYISYTEKLFKRLTILPDECRILNIIKKNLLLYLFLLALQEPKTIDELSILCKKLEDAQSLSPNFKHPHVNNTVALGSNNFLTNTNQYRSNNSQ
ncbi:unnamed protein product [Psylliodes chrysocephalus]|uniref:Retrotransposon gag domain-containing protein n=1 Tax=Psylliodes chrysocephalus TaxID=3402493 RepID=A0A9P0CRQ6_9CUCU|nr:unnamed protein product [Psylliodes chrysocephala]